MPNNLHLWEVLIFFFHLKKTRPKAHREFQKVYGHVALSGTTCRDWFRRFKDGDFDVDYRPREERPKTFEDADVIYYQLLKPNETITGERYRTQLMRLRGALREKRPQYDQRPEKVILQHVNARLHVAEPVKTYLETLEWECSDGTCLADQQFRSYEDIEKCLDSWIASKYGHFYHNGIRALSERWAKVVADDGQ